MFGLILFICLVQNATAVIYRLNASDYSRMPPIYHMDPYDKCHQDPKGLYCLVDVVLTSDEPSSLLDMIQDFSAHKLTHFNHSLLQFGICVTQSCAKFQQNEGKDLTWTLEACLNESLETKYQLKAKILPNYYCTEPNTYKPIDMAELTVAIVCACIILANIVGSYCDYFCVKGEDSTYLKYLLCFSLQRNWRKLVSAANEKSEPRVQRLKCLHGIRVMTMIKVIISHTFASFFFLIDNPEFIENKFVSSPSNILFGGTVVMQKFLLLSSFLLVYNWLIFCEKSKASWSSLPKQLFLRWLRLMPSYAVILCLTATWYGRVSSGPTWQKAIGDEVRDCRKYWWQHLLFINNYFDDTRCIIQTWYLATDMQLYCLALVVFLLCRTPRAKKVILSLLFVVAMIAPAVHAYYQNLVGVFIATPTTVFNMFLGDPTFNNLYKRGHTNMCGCVVGMALAYLVYHVQKSGTDVSKYQKYRYCFNMLFPLSLVCWYSATLFLEDGPPQPVYVNVLFAALLKPLFTLITAALIFGCIFQLEDLFCGFYEWRGWAPLSRLSYGAYLTHLPFLQNFTVVRTIVYTMTDNFMVVRYIQVLVLAYSAGFLIWILVETPFKNLRDELFASSKRSSKGKYVEEKSAKNGKIKM